MELELGLKITHTRDDITSHTELRIDKNYTGPLFLSKETETIFFLIAYLKGFRRENIDININGDGSRIAISGKKAVQEMVLTGWIMHRKDAELRAFRKVFRIPDGVILDRIKAKFNDEESSLTIIMPKLVKGMRGLEIEEVKEEKEFDREPKLNKVEEIEQAVQKEIERKEESEIPRVLAYENDKEAKKQSVKPKIESRAESDQVVDQGRRINATKAKAQVVSEIDNQENKEVERVEEKKANEGEFNKIEDVEDMKMQEIPKESEKAPLKKAEPSTTSMVEDKKQSPAKETQNEKLLDSKEQQKKHEIQTGKEKLQEHGDKQESSTKSKQEQAKKAVKNEMTQESQNQEPKKPKPEDEEQELVEVEKQKGLSEEVNKTESRTIKKGSKLRPPLVVAGSAILVSLIVLVINFIRAKKKMTKM